MRRLGYLALLLAGLVIGSLFPLDLLAQNRASIGNLQADNMTAGTKLGLGVVILDGSGNPVTSFGGTGGTSMTDDAAFTVASGSVTPAAGIYRSTLDSVDDGDAGALAMRANRILMVNIVDTSGVAQTISGTQYTQDAALTVATSVGTMAMGRASAAAPTGVSADDDAVLPWYLRSGAQATQPTYAGILAVAGNGVAGTGVQRVTIASDSTGQVALAAGSAVIGHVIVDSGGGGGTQYTHDAALTIGSSIGTLAMGRASAAVPTDVSADNDAVAPWYLRSGALAAQPTFAGVLAVAGNGASGTGVQRVTIANDSTGIIALTTSSAVIGHVIVDSGTISAHAVTNAGTFVVQENGAALTALQLIDNIPNTLGSTTSGQSGVLGLCAATTAAPTYTTAQSNALSCTTAGSLRVDIMNGGGGGTSAADNASFTDNTTVLTLIGGAAESASPTACTEGKLCAAATTLNRALKVTLYDTSGNALTPSQDQTQDAALTIATTTGPAIMGRASAAVPTDVSANDDAVLAWFLRSGAMVTQPSYGGVLASAGNGASGTGVPRVTIANDSTGILAGVTTVSTVTNLSQFGAAAINLGTGTVGTGTLRIVIASDDPVNDFAVKGDANMVAHDAADAGNPLKIGFKATSSISGQTMVATADRTDSFAGLDGVLITRPHSNLEDRVSAVVGVTDGSSTSLVAAQGSGIRFCATTFVVSNSSATNVTVDIRDGTAGSVIMTIPAAANMGGAVVPMATPLCTTANTAMAMDPSSSASTVTVTALGFKTKL